MFAALKREREKGGERGEGDRLEAGKKNCPVVLNSL